MFALFNLLRTIASWLGFNLTEIWRVAAKLLSTKWAVFILLIGLVWWIMTDAVGFLVTCASLLAELVFTGSDLSMPGELSYWMSAVNTFWPLAESLTMAIAYGILISIMALYRHAKTMIPSPLPGGGGS